MTQLWLRLRLRYALTMLTRLRHTAGTATCGVYDARLDPFGLGTSNTGAAGRMLQRFPRYFLLAAKYDLHAPGLLDSAAGTTLAGASVHVRAMPWEVWRHAPYWCCGMRSMPLPRSQVTLRSMAGSSCTMEAVSKRLPQSMTIAALKQLFARLYKAEPAMQRLSYRDSAVRLRAGVASSRGDVKCVCSPSLDRRERTLPL